MGKITAYNAMFVSSIVGIAAVWVILFGILLGIKNEWVGARDHIIIVLASGILFMSIIFFSCNYYDSWYMEKAPEVWVLKDIFGSR